MEEIEGLDQQTGSALGMGPGAVHVVEDAPIVSQDQAFLGKRGPQPITAQAFQARAVSGRNSLGGMD